MHHNDSHLDIQILGCEFIELLSCVATAGRKTRIKHPPSIDIECQLVKTLVHAGAIGALAAIHTRHGTSRNDQELHFYKPNDVFCAATRALCTLANCGLAVGRIITAHALGNVLHAVLFYSLTASHTHAALRLVEQLQSLQAVRYV